MIQKEAKEIPFGAVQCTLCGRFTTMGALKERLTPQGKKTSFLCLKCMLGNAGLLDKKNE
jgi:hypothetical protein